MKITAIRIQNFLGISSLDLTIEKPLVLVAGPNCSGKTSLAHGLRYVLTGDLCRIQHKKNIKALVRDGAKTGQVSATVEGMGTYTRSAATGEYLAGSNGGHHPALAYLLDPPAFLALAPNERRDFLFRLMGVSMAAGDIVKRLEARGHIVDAGMVVQLRSGFQGAHSETQAQARERKAQWREVTGGETYGELKAESWAAQSPALPSDGVEQLDGELAALEESIGQAQAEIGAVRARAEEARRMAERLTRTRADAEHIEKYAAVEQAVRQQLDRLVAEERKLTDDLREAENKATLASRIPQGMFLPCPECGAALVYDRGSLKPGKPATQEDMDALAQAEHDLAERQQALKILQGTHKTKESELLYATEALGRAKSAKETLANFKAVDDDQSAESADAILKRMEALKQQREKLRAEIQAHNQARKLAAEAASKTDRARALHEEIKALTALAAELAPDGLPAELLSLALGPINQRLADSAAMTGWPQVSVTTDGIAGGQRPLALASQSEHWRAGAMIAEATAHLSGLKIMCLDGMDILDAPSRAQAIAWLTSIAHDHDVIVVLATLKEKPKGLGNAVQVVWLGGEA